MNPEVYMCYLISAKDGNFKRLARKWNSEFKTYSEISTFKSFSKTMTQIRLKNKHEEWSNFNVESLLIFINEHLHWAKDE